MPFRGELEAEYTPEHDRMNGSNLLDEGKTDPGHLVERAVHPDDDVARVGRASDVTHDDVLDHIILQRGALLNKGPLAD